MIVYDLINSNIKERQKERICLNCGSDKTYINKYISKLSSPCWYKHEGGYLCQKCYCKLIENPRYYKRNADKIKIKIKNKNKK